ncbi:DUF4127 family protein [Bacillus timonensis]|uniref:DUF4127 family protein n=1 Tax=Bacillus timonensis TaxID=1033734 RepID=A0A4S3PQH8_9BACI|nr:DUF4127 family protein [Bacillus timonensis]THE11911.1 DUF4127 family protein [Bacillus timonensis]
MWLKFQKELRNALVFAVIISLVMIVVPQKKLLANELERSLGDISLVPLDDRQFNVYTPEKIAEIGGFHVNTPKIDLLGKYFTPGNSKAIGEWWIDNASKTSSSVVAIPMLAYGGLINSRYEEISLENAKENLNVLKEFKKQNPDKKLYAYDTLTRLTISPTRDYPGNFAGEIREWAILKDKIENLGMNEPELIQRYEELNTTIPGELIKDYLKTRERNFSINNLMIDWVNEGIIDYLIIGQDDAEPHGLHRPEHAALEKRIHNLNLEDKIDILPGADVVGALLITKLMMEKIDVHPKVYVEYSRIHGDDWIAPYQNIPYSQLIKNYITILGGTIVSEPNEADILLMANSAGAEEINTFADKIYEYIGKGYNVTVGDDARAGVADSELIDLLSKRIKFSDLYGYSGWNIGVSITQSFARFGLLESITNGKLNILESSSVAHLELLLEALAHEDAYRNFVRDDTKKFAESFGEDPQNIINNFEEVNQFAVSKTMPLANEWFKNHFLNQQIKLGGNENIIGTVTGLSEWDMFLPWNRYQELAAFPELALTLSPTHKNVLVRNTPMPFSSVASLGNKTQKVSVLVTNEHTLPIKGEVILELPEDWSATLDEGDFSLDPNESTMISFIVNIPSDVTPEQTYQLLSNVNYNLIRGNGQAHGQSQKTSTNTFYITPKHINHALETNGGVATASSQFSTYKANFAIDGNATNVRSRWISAKADINWLQVNFPEKKATNNVKIIGYNGYELNDYKVQALQNGSWIDVVSVSGNIEATTEHVFETIETDAVRLLITKTRDGMARIYEFEVYKK